MIELDLIKWISDTLATEMDLLSEYSLEYATALLMNLSLRSSGKDKCESAGLLKVLSELIEHENSQVRTYVNGTLYSIFTRKKLREEAKSLGMKEMLQYLMSQSGEQLQRQIVYILEQLNQTDSAEVEEIQSLNGDEEFEDENDDDDELMETDEGEFDDFISEPGILVGEQWL